jgi:iron complex outermembrane receptor protein
MHRFIDRIPLDGGDVSTGSDIGLGGSSARNPLNFINQNDIESLTVQDASSTAIYGSRGANGVIVLLLKIKIKETQLTYSNAVVF